MKKFTATLASLIILGLAATSLPVLGVEDGEDQGQRILDRLDTDGDGVVSFKEYRPRERRMMGNLDTNEDGKLTLDEFLNGRSRENTDDQREVSEERKARMAEMMAQRFARMDVDDDGSVTMEEIKGATFAAMDRNDDGVLSAKELRPRRGMRPGGGRRGGNRANRRPPQ